MPRTFDSLANKLAARPTTPGPRERHPAPEPDRYPAEPARVSTSASHSDGPRTTHHTPRAGGALRTISFLAPVALRDRLRAKARLDATTQADVVLDAIETAYPHLNDLITDARPVPNSTALFTRTPRRRTSEVTAPVSIRLPLDAIATIDKLVNSAGAANRTRLLTTALQHYLSSHDATAEALDERG